MTSSIVFIDSRVPDIDSLIGSLGDGTAFCLLDAGKDGLAQIAEILSSHAGLDSIRIISHGGPGSLMLGAGTVDSATLDTQSDILASIGASLNPDGDLLLYGCSVAEGDDGAAFIAHLAQLTGADVAASTDPTGAGALGGDWELEAQTGAIEAGSLQPMNFSGILASGNTGGSVTIAGTVTQNQTLTASNTITDPDTVGAITYQWQSSSDGGTTWNDAAVGATLVLPEALVGMLVRVAAKFTDGSGSAEVVNSSATAAVANVNDNPSGSATFTGTATQGQTLTATNTIADADGLGTITYQWQSFDGLLWSPIVGSTGAILTLGQNQVGKTVRVMATYTDGHSTVEQVASSASTTVANINDSPSGTINISGTVTINQTLTASLSAGFSDPDGLGIVSYQWQSSSDGSTWSNLSTGSSLGLSQAQVSKYIRVIGSYTDSQGTAETVTSSATAIVTGINTLPTGSVTIAGTATQNQTLTASNTLADVDGLGSITYQWQTSSDGGTTWNNLSTGSTVTLADAQVGKLVRVTANYVDGQSTSESVASTATAAVANVNDALTGGVIITGTATQNQTLTASNSLADGDGLGAITYQWQTSNDAGATWNNLSTGTTLTLSEAEVGLLVRVQASYTDGHGTAESANSSATSAVANVNDSPTGSVTIAGTVTQGQILTASNTLADIDTLGAITYQWQTSSDGGSTWGNLSAGGTVALAEAQVGKLVRVTASYTDGHGTAETVASTATAAVANLNDSPTGTVSITGTVSQGQTLTASNTLADIDTLGTITYQWQTSNDGGTTWSNLSTGSTVTLAQAQVGLTMRVLAGYTDGHSTVESVASTATAAVTNVNDSPTGSVTIAGTATQNQTLTASNTLADTDVLGAITYQWQTSSDSGATWNNLSAGSTVTLADAEVGKLVRVVASYTDGQGTAESIASTATTAVVNVNDALTGGVTIAGTVTQNQILTASNTLTDGDGLGAITYQWQASSDAGATWSNLNTGSTITLAEAQVGKLIRATASYTDGHGTVETTASTATAAVANVNDALTGSLTVTGTAMVNQTLSAANTFADVDGLGTISYQWQSSSDSGATWSNLVGATSSILTLNASHLGNLIRATASYTDGHGTLESANSTATTAVLAPNSSPTGSVTITGAATQNVTLKATNTVADADGLGVITYQWQDSSDGTTWSNLTTGSSLTLAEAQVGKFVRVQAKFNDGQGTAESVSSSATTVVANVNDSPTGTVTISGTATLGQVLTASNSVADTDGFVAITYKWQSSSDGTTWADISTGSTLGLSEAQVGLKIRVLATYTDTHGTAESVASTATNAITNVNNAPTGAVTIAGTVTQGQTLTASNSIADTDGLGTITYQWQSSSNGGTTWANISTGTTLTLAEAQVGKTIRAVASYTDGLLTSETVASTATAAVANLNDSPTGSVTVSGSLRQGQTLTASNDIADADGLGTITYQWQSSSNNGTTWTNLTTGSTLTLSASEVGKLIRAVAGYTDLHSTSETVTSSATSAVLVANALPTGAVTFSGTVRQGQVLTASNSIADTNGLGAITYQWQNSSDGTTWTNLGTGSTLTLAEAQVDSFIRVVASYTDGLGASETVLSDPSADVVENINDAPTGDVSIDGTLSVGQTLTAVSTIIDPDGVGDISYLWQSSSNGTTWTDIALGETLELTGADAGYRFRVIATYTDGHGTDETVTGSTSGSVGGYGNGSDKINAGNGDNIINAGGGNNIITAGAGDDQITAGGGADRISAGDGDNSIDAGDGNNSITTGAGDDQITAGSGADKIDAGSGDDTIVSGAGKDKITLGLGADVLVLNNIGEGGADSVTYFNATEDTFAFDGSVFEDLAGGITDDNLIIGTKVSAGGEGGQLLYNSKTRKLYYDPDGGGGEKAILLVSIKTVIGTIDSDNFSII